MGNSISEPEALPRLRSNDATLTYLNLGGDEIGKEEAIALADALKENTTLTTLNLENNQIGKEGAIALADALKENTTLTTLNLEKNQIGKEGAIALADALKENTTLTMLNLENNQIGKEGAIALADALRENTTLTMLNLENNQIGNEGAIALADALKENTTLTMLNLGWNKIGKEGAIALADALKENTTLTTLHLKWNKIGNEGAIALAEALKENATLTSLDLESNEIDKEGVVALADALKENTTLTELNLESNIMDRLTSALPRLRSNDTTLTTLNLRYNEIGNEGTIALADALKENTTLTTLNLGNNEIGNEGAIALADALKGNTTLTTLELENNQIGDEGAIAKSNILDITHRNGVFRRHKDDTEVDGFSFYFAMNEETEMLYIKESVWEAAAATDGLVLELVHNVIRDHLDACKEDDLQSTKDELKTLLNTSRNSDGSPLLHLAAARTSAEALALCQYLVKEIGFDLDHAVTDKAERTARDIAMAGNLETRNWAKSVGTFLGRYRIEEEGRYKSATCTVNFATDVEKSKRDPARNVAIKIMHNREQFDRELKQRLGGSLANTSNGFDLYTKDDSGAMIENGKGLNRFDVDHVVPLLRYHIENFEGKRYHCLIMLKGERNLDEIIRYEGMAGKDVNKITYFAVDLAKALNHLHSDHNMIHADVKPRNVVRIRGDNKLIDFDASISIGERLTEKFSSGYLPPEVAAVKFRPEEKIEDLMRRKENLEREIQESARSGNFDVVSTQCEELKGLEDTIKQVECSGPNSVKEEPVASAQVDIWSFGVLVFELLTGRPLFNCDANDNLLSDKEKRRLVNWKGITDNDLSHVLQVCEDQDLTDSAKDLLRECLSTEQSRPKTFHQVLKHPFLNRKELQLQKLDEGQKNIESTVKSGFNEMNVKLDQTHKMLSEMQTELANVSRGVSNILKGCHAPKLMCIIPADSSVKDWINLNALVGKKVKFIFICPVTLSIPRDGNNKPMGYSMEMPRDWVRKYGPALKISYEILRIGFAVGRFAGLPLPNLSSAGSSTNVMNVLNDNLVDYMGEGALDLKELAGVLGDRVTLAVTEADENLSKHDDNMRTKIIASYEEVKNIAKRNKDEDYMKTGLSKVECDGHVEYVLDKAEIKSIYQQMGPTCLGLPQAELQARGADLGVVMKEGYLEKEIGLKWEMRYVILRKGGFLTHYESKEEWQRDPFGVMGKPKPKIVAVNKERTGKSFKLTYEGGKCRSFKSTKSAVDTEAEIKNWVEKAGAHL